MTNFDRNRMYSQEEFDQHTAAAYQEGVDDALRSRGDVIAFTPLESSELRLGLKLLRIRRQRTGQPEGALAPGELRALASRLGPEGGA